MSFPGIFYPGTFYPAQPFIAPIVDPPRGRPHKSPKPPPWNYFATRLDGDGPEEQIATELPISGLQFTKEVTGPGGLSGTISPELKRLTADDGKPVFLPRSTAIYAEADGHPRYGAVLTNMTANGPSLGLTCTGFTAMPNGEPYNGIRSRVGADTMDEYRHLWDHFQGQPRKDYGLTFDDTKSGITTGVRKYKITDKEDTSEIWDASTMGNKKGDSFYINDAGTRIYISDAAAKRMLEENENSPGPYKVNYWSTHDIGKQLADLTQMGRGFDYRTEFSWNGEDIRKFVRLGRRIGRRRENDRYVVGENIFQNPDINYRGEDYASEVIVLGAGEGRNMKRGSASRRTNRMGRTIVVVDDSLDSNRKCDAKAVREMRRRMGEAHIDQFTVLTHELTADEGDEILFQNTGGWAGAEEVWVRIMAITTSPESPESLLKVARVEAL